MRVIRFACLFWHIWEKKAENPKTNVPNAYFGSLKALWVYFGWALCYNPYG
jgi:hypothetical protein